MSTDPHPESVPETAGGGTTGEKQLTRKQAIAFAESEAWKRLELKERAQFQFGQQLLCMPFGAFHEAAEALLGRPVWTHEFADTSRLMAEAEGRAPKPSMADIIALLPADKTVILATQPHAPSDAGGEG